MSNGRGLYVVAGATGAIGRTLSQKILQKGCGTPLLIGRSIDKLTQVNDQYLNGKGMVFSKEIDFTQPTEAYEILSSELKGQELQGLAYAVGSITLKPIRGCKAKDYMDSYILNVIGATELIKACLPGLKKGATGSSSTTTTENEEENNPTVVPNTSSIVLFSSIAAQHGLMNHSVIGSTKAAVEGLTVSLAAEFASSNIRVNCVAPSLTGGGSAMAQSMVSNEKLATALASSHPLGRLGLPNDSASAAAFLLDSRESSWMTGTILPVDGGRSTILR